MAAGLGRLGLSPRDFWSMTPRELDAALRGRFGLTDPLTPPAVTDLARLMQQFPDDLPEAAAHAVRAGV